MLNHAPEAGRAWAGGNLQALSTLTSAAAVVIPCWGHLTNASIARQQGIDLQHSMDTAWLAGLHDVSSRHKIIFTTAPIHDLIYSQGIIRLLLNEGFVPKNGLFSPHF